MADYGLLGGIAKGISAGVDGYMAAKKMQRDEQTQSMLMAQHGLIQNPDGSIDFSPEEKMKRQNALQAEQDKRQIDLIKTDIDARNKGLLLKRDGSSYSLEKDPNYVDQDREYKRLQIQKLRSEIGGEGGGKQLPPAQVLSVNEGVALPESLKDIRATIEENKDMFGPIKGTLTSMNPWSEKGQTMDAQLRTAAQAFGRYMEGGVLRKEDEEKYRKMFPQLGDTPEIAKNKLDIVERKLISKLQSDESALKGSGYNTAGFSKSLGLLKKPETPSVLAGKKGVEKEKASAKSQKPKKVIQNGHEYILNESTGEYE